MSGLIGIEIAAQVAKMGAPILGRMLAGDKGEAVATVAVDTLAKALGVPATDVGKALKETPGADVVVQKAEADYGPAFAALAEGQTKLALAETGMGPWHAWRPALSWLTGWFWLQNCTVFPIANAAFGATLPLIPWEYLTTFSGLWLTVYGGGHTLKSILGK